MTTRTEFTPQRSRTALAIEQRAAVAEILCIADDLPEIVGHLVAVALAKPVTQALREAVDDLRTWSRNRAEIDAQPEYAATVLGDDYTGRYPAEDAAALCERQIEAAWAVLTADVGPQLGDRVLYVGPETGGYWNRRSTTPGVVVRVNSGSDAVGVYSVDDTCYWSTRADWLRVVVRAVYVPVDQIGGE